MNAALVLLFAAVAAPQDSGFAGGFRFRELPNLRAPAFPGGIAGINDLGEILLNDPERGAIRVGTDGTETELGKAFNAIAINNRGQILVSAGSQLFIRQPDGRLEERVWPSTPGVGSGLNDLGVALGSATLWDAEGRPSGLRVPQPARAAIVGATGLFGVNNRGTILGISASGGGPYQVWRRTQDGFYSEIGRLSRLSTALGIGDDLSFYTHGGNAATFTIVTTVLDAADRIVYRTSTSITAPDSTIPLFDRIGPRGQLLLGHRYNGGYFFAETCPTGVSVTEADVASGGGTVRVSVRADADCEWYYGERRRGSGDVEIAVGPSVGPRTLHEMVAGKEITIRQNGGACEYLLPGEAIIVEGVGGDAQIPITTGEGCPWTIQHAPEVRVSPISGAGPAVVTVTVEPTRSHQPRFLGFSIGNRPFGIYQDARPCSFEITAPATVGPGQGTATVARALGGCALTGVSSAPWLRPGAQRPTAPGESAVLAAYDANTGSQPRSAELRFGDRVFRVTQEPSGAGAALLVEPHDGVGPRRSFRFVFAEPLTEARITLGKECMIDYRTGFRPYTLSGTCQLNGASTASAGQFKTIELDLTVAERGLLPIAAAGRHLGVFEGSDWWQPPPAITHPDARVIPSARLSPDSSEGLGGTFRAYLNSLGRGPIPKVTLTFYRLDSTNGCRITLDVASRRMTLDGEAGVTVGRPGTLENSQCVVNGEPGSYQAVDASGSQAVWDVNVLFRSAWAGKVFVDLSNLLVNFVVGGDAGTYDIKPAVLRPSLVTYSGVTRIGFSAHYPIRAARVRIGECQFRFEPGRGLEAVGDRCTLDRARSSATVIGNDVVLMLATASTGDVLAEATPSTGVASGWFSLGRLEAAP